MTTEADVGAEKILTANLARVIDWVRYGDAKNAALLAFASAWLAGLGNAILAAEEKRTVPVITVMLFLAWVLFLAAAIHALAALLPKTNPLEWLHRTESAHGRSLLFFGSISTLTVEEFRAAVTGRYKATGKSPIAPAYVTDLCSQTVINSKVAQRKFTLFDRGACCVLAALFVLVLPLVIGLVRIIWGP